MAIFKCKMCGGNLELNGDSAVATCDYCGSVQTLPKKNDDVIANLFNRANNLRLKNEFDKAAEIYEKIINEDNTEAEAYWGLVLCKYGIEYVEDPKTYKRVPTCHRTQYESILSDVDFLATIENADGARKSVYQEEAEKISALQKDILAIVKKEKPFDVFICYKETDESGKRTVDSALANDIYYQLTQEGLKVFYAAITLEDKLGQEYEPYIFAALNSAKVMLVVGTKPEYFEAVWVKNEWSRYLKLMKTDRSKLLIPCYRDMDAYDLPEEFSHLQAQDMSKIGFVNDVVRGIKKVITAETKKAEPVKETVIVNTSADSNTAPLLERAFMFLEDGDWQSADEYCEKVLDLDPKCAEAYLGKLMAELRVNKRENLKACANTFDDRNNYQKALRFGDEKLKKELVGYIEFITERNLAELYDEAVDIMKKAHSSADFRKASVRFMNISFYKDSESLAETCDDRAQNIAKEEFYNERIQEMQRAQSEADFRRIASNFEPIKDFKDSAEKIKLCLEKAEGIRKDAILAEGKEKMNSHISRESAMKLFESISGWKDADEQLARCRELDEEYKANIAREKILADEKKKKAKKNAKIVGPIVAVAIIFIIILNTVIIPSSNYKKAVEFEMSGDITSAIAHYNKAGNYNDAKEKCLALWDNITLRETISAGLKHTVGLKKDGTVVATGDNLWGQCDVSYWTDIIAISAGYLHTVGLKKDGTVVAVGDKDYDQCDVSYWTDIVAISAGCHHTVGLKKDGTVVAVGHNSDGRCDVSDWSDIIAISAGDYHTVGLKKDGTVVAVGDNGYDRCNVSDWSDIIAISAGKLHTVGLKKDGTVVAVGDKDYDQCDVSYWTDIVAISAGYHHTVGLKKDGTVVAVGHNSDGRCDVSDWTDIIAISAGDYHTVGLKKDGTVVAVGYNGYDQCDVSDWKDIKVPNN